MSLTRNRPEGLVALAGLCLAFACGDAAQTAPDQGLLTAGSTPPRTSALLSAAAPDPLPLFAGTRRPVVLVAGLMQDENTVAPLAGVLRDRGLDVTLWIPPNSGLDDIHGYATQLGQTIEAVLQRTGAAQVDLVGHSEGGVTARRYVKNLGADAPVATLISLGSPQQGTEGGALSLLLLLTGCTSWAEACGQMMADSDFMRDLNSDDPTPGNVRYVALGTEQDGVVQPVSRSQIPGGENVVMQRACPLRAVGHFGLFSDAWVHQVVLSVLSGGPPRGNCLALPVGGLL